MGNRWSRRQEQASGSYGAFGPIATGATVAATLYTTWRLYQTYTEKKDQDNNDIPRPSPKKQNISFSSSDDSGIENIEDAAKSGQGQSPGDLLRLYYKEHVRKTDSDMEKAKVVVKEVTDMFYSFLKLQKATSHVHSMIPFGSAYEEANVTDDFDILIRLDLEENMWSLVSGRDTLMSAPGHWLVQRENQDFFTKGASIWDSCLTGGYLSPVKICQLFQGRLQQGISWTSNYNLYPSLTGSKLVLTVGYGDSKTLRVTFTPCVHFKGTWIIATPHPQAAVDAAYQNFWLQSFHEQERKIMLEKVATEESGCKCQCLQLIKAIRLRNPYFKCLDSYVFKTLLFHLIDDEDKWNEDDLPDRFIDFLKMMEHHIRLKSLPNHFVPDINLFSDYSEEDLWAILSYLQSLLRKKPIRLLNNLLH